MTCPLSRSLALAGVQGGKAARGTRRSQLLAEPWPVPLGPVSGVTAVTPSTPVSPAEVEGLQEWELGGVWGSGRSSPKGQAVNGENQREEGKWEGGRGGRERTGLTMTTGPQLSVYVTRLPTLALVSPVCCSQEQSHGNAY